MTHPTYIFGLVDMLLRKYATKFVMSQCCHYIHLFGDSWVLSCFLLNAIDTVYLDHHSHSCKFTNQYSFNRREHRLSCIKRIVFVISAWAPAILTNMVNVWVWAPWYFLSSCNVLWSHTHSYPWMCSGYPVWVILQKSFTSLPMIGG